MAKQKEYFELGLDALRALGGWAADCAARALPIHEAQDPGDARPRDAVEGIRLFARGGKRVARLRVLAMDAFRASHAIQDPAAAAAARAASLAAASAYTHPFADVQQARHILGPAAYAALAVELHRGNDPRAGDLEVRWAVEQVPAEVWDILRHMPLQPAGKTRVEKLMQDLDVGLRAKFKA